MKARMIGSNAVIDDPIIVEPLSKAHLEGILDIHLNELKSSLTSYFGRDFVSKMYLQMLENGWGFAAVKTSNSQVQGYIFADRKFKFFRCLTSLSTLKVTLAMITNPSALTDILASVFHQLYMRFVVSETANSKVVEISNLAVLEASKSRGIGSTLISAFEQQARQSGYTTISTNTQNSRLVQFYMHEKNARQVCISKVFNRRTILLHWDLK